MKHPAVMGVVNVTPDSFYEASRVHASSAATERGAAFFAAGCDIVDVGGESTRPGAATVSADEELARVLPVVTALAPVGLVSIDTQKESVASAALAAGAGIVNDVSGTLYEVAARHRAGYVAMHRQGDAATMQANPTYHDVVAEVLAFLGDIAARARSAGVGDLWLDYGIGFGKTTAHNLALLAATDQFVALARDYDAHLLVGASRKRFLGDISGENLPAAERLEGTVAVHAWALQAGADVIRVHDVPVAVQLRELLVRPTDEVVAS